jgi:hypothetical protein
MSEAEVINSTAVEVDIAKIDEKLDQILENQEKQMELLTELSETIYELDKGSFEEYYRAYN